MATNEATASRPSTRQRLPRSRNGCLTCRRRKVRCNEQKPRCSHCERLDLQCTWRTNTHASNAGQNRAEEHEQHSHRIDFTDAPGSFEDNLDFNNVLWQDALQFDSVGLDWSNPEGSQVSQGRENSTDRSLPNRTLDIADGTDAYLSSPRSVDGGQAQLPDLPQLSPASWTSANTALDVDRNGLVEHFLASLVPPILAAVETGPRWTSTKMLLISLAAGSNLVQDAIAAFSALEVGDDTLDAGPTHQVYYNRAKAQILSAAQLSSEQTDPFGDELPSLLVAVFFLSYSALLSDRVEDAHALLQYATRSIRSIPNDRMTSTLKRLISWIRLVDGRASSVGGPGLFLSETDRHANSPLDMADKSISRETPSGAPDELEEILFDMLYTPGLIFYQRVQSIMARVSAIDKWHRTRGTVRDETEVMTIAANISSDLVAIEMQRPALMDSAVAGDLTDKYLMAGLSSAIARSYRTYWANYHAGHIHLHRVAYTHLEATAEVHRARDTIKSIARLLEKSHDQLPANFIWPLLMACCEENDPHDRVWMIAAIRGMQTSATNAKPIAHVLEEVHRRQDTTQRRADIRQTSMDLFNKSFAVF